MISRIITRGFSMHMKARQIHILTELVEAEKSKLKYE